MKVLILCIRKTRGWGTVRRGVPLEYIVRERQGMAHIKGAAVLYALEAIKARAGKDELEKIVAHLGAEDRKILAKAISPSSWYSPRRLCAFSRG